MEKEKLVKTIVDLRVAAGQSETKRANAAREFNRVPQSGTFEIPINKEFELIDENGESRKVISLGLKTKEGDFVSETALTRANLLPELVQIRTGLRRGKKMLRMQRLTDLTPYGKSQNEQLAALCGKKFTAKPVEIRTYKQEFLSSSEAFDAVCVSADSVKDEKKVVDTLLKKTEVTTGYIFEITEPDETAE